MRFPPLLLILSLLFLYNCSDNISGGPGGQTTNGITATLLSSLDSLAIDSAKITLRPINYITGDELTIDTSSAFGMGDTFSSKNGTFNFSNIIPGKYLLECLFNDSLGIIESLTVETDSSNINLNEIYAKKVGSVSGNVDTSGFPLDAVITVFIKGIEKSITAKPDGNFNINALAPWTYDFIINITSKSDTITKTLNGDVISDSESELDSIDLYAPFNPFQYIAVRKFLNNMGFYDITVDSVTKDIDGQIYLLQLYNLNIDKIHSSVNKLNFLEELSFLNNSLTSLPPEIGELDSIKKLSISNNNLTQLPDEISLMGSLEEIWIIRNNLVDIPLSIGKLKRLKKLELCFNNMSVFPEGFTNLDSIEMICIDNNLIDSLPSTIGNIKSLKILDLEANNLKILPEAISNLTNLTKIDLDSNNITYLPESMMDSLILLDTLELTYNSIDSSQYSPAFVQWLNSKSDFADWILTQELR